MTKRGLIFLGGGVPLLALIALLAWASISTGGNPGGLATNSDLLEFDIARRARERSLYPAWKMLHHSSNKVARILGIQPLIESGIIRFAKHLVPKHPQFFGQFDEFPGAEHDDGPDTAEMVVRLLEKGGIVGLPNISQRVGGKSSYWRDHG